MKPLSMISTGCGIVGGRAVEPRRGLRSPCACRWKTKVLPFQAPSPARPCSLHRRVFSLPGLPAESMMLEVRAIQIDPWRKESIILEVGQFI